MNIYILEDDLMQQTRISDIIRELVSEGAFSVQENLKFFLNHINYCPASTRRGTIRFFFWILILMAIERRG